jgi:hypothetical protein
MNYNHHHPPIALRHIIISMVKLPNTDDIVYTYFRKIAYLALSTHNIITIHVFTHIQSFHQYCPYFCNNKSVMEAKINYAIFLFD